MKNLETYKRQAGKYIEWRSRAYPRTGADPAADLARIEAAATLAEVDAIMTDWDQGDFEYLVGEGVFGT
jgi:hypothetical protein